MGGVDISHEWIILDRLADVILHHVEGCIVEIGVGKSTPVLARHAIKFGVKHYAVDIRGRSCRQIEANPEANHDGLFLFNCSSLDFIEVFDDTPALVLLDGCHDSDVVMQETMFFLHRMPPGGVIFLHDTYLSEGWEKKLDGYNWFSDTYRVRWELENLKDVWCFTFPYTANACGVTIVMKRPEWEHTANPLDLVGSHPRGPRMSGRYRWGK